ncbi:hypothetical protein GYMLUDRAFT_41659 [Collybiopsis luxurians FD-317 M1]|uniref:Uncharacterized protein n=1 Tax=Collybiopsis luxurians FD-317 M1 TaxID=944289 RepID=A0A0D0D106_9AGAR|nr:hypothetical protein GYMLUDRAFT_41659 [Collybiopsis luxurians FD-317 M1]
MLFKLSLLTCLVPFAAGLILNTPANAVSGESMIVSWVAAPDDPNFALLINNEGFSSPVFLPDDANIDPHASSEITVSLVDFPARSGYWLEARNVTELAIIYAESAQFTITAA